LTKLDRDATLGSAGKREKGDILDSFWHLRMVSLSHNNVYRVRFNVLGQRVQFIDGNNHASTFGFDEVGNQNSGINGPGMGRVGAALTRRASH
jgi:hypothetical protein